MTTITLQWPDGRELPVIGQGTWHMGESTHQRKAEVKALQHGLACGLTLIDTAEMYGDGGAESVVGEALQNRRHEAFVVSKVYPHHASYHTMVKACERSLERLKIETIDCYLLHWGSSTPTEEIIEGFMRLEEAGKIRGYGVSNLDDRDMADWWHHAKGSACQTDQVLYHLGSRGVEYRLLPWLQTQGRPMMAYCPLAQNGRLRQQLMSSSALVEVAHRHSATVHQVLLAWAVREQRGRRGVIAIPKAVDFKHIEDNVAAMALHLSTEDLNRLDDAWPAPTQRLPLEVE